jgi:O-antigen ligase/TolA-binding protein
MTIMRSGGTATQIARWVALGALFLLPFAPLFGADTIFPFSTGSLFFPFITGKGFFIRIIIEIVFAAWVVLIFLDKEYRPRYSWIGVIVVSFVAWMLVADIFAVNSLKAFWSNFERMEGWVLLIHLLAFFLASSAILRTEKKWRTWFLTSLGASVLVSLYALMQLGGSTAIHQGSTRIDASFGNSAYLAIYFLFNVFVALWLALTEKYAWLKWSLIGLAVLESVLVFFTETRGTVIGLVLGFVVAAFLTAVTSGARMRRYAVGALALILVLVGSFYLARNSSFVQNNGALRRVASISLSDGQVRFTIWHLALRGVAERPLLGWGQEGFNYVFNKYYDPSLYAQEQWFDRAHNAFIDWLTAGGIPAFLLYIALFGSALTLLWKSTELSRSERTLLTAALVGYAVHNMFVFDNLYSYIYFFAILALIDSQVGKPITSFQEAAVATEADGLTYALPIAAVACFGLIWFVNVTGIQSASKLITALSSSDDPNKNLAIFQDFAMHPIPQMQEVREQLIPFAGAVLQNQGTTNEQKQQAYTFALTEIQKQIQAYPNDAREYIQLSYLYRTAGDNTDALKALTMAVSLSPKKEEFYIEKGTVEWNLGDVKSAQTDFNTAYTLGPKFTDLALYAAAGDIAAGDLPTADAILKSTFGSISVDSDVLVTAYYRAKNWPRLIALLQGRVNAPTASANTWFSLAAAYYESGDSASAIRTINATVAKFPDSAASGAAAIKQIQQGK